jgi:hypothetical protein
VSFLLIHNYIFMGNQSCADIEIRMFTTFLQSVKARHAPPPQQAFLSAVLPSARTMLECLKRELIGSLERFQQPFNDHHDSTSSDWRTCLST